MPSSVSILDCTLRDGASAIAQPCRQPFGPDETFAIARALDRAGFRFIEVGPGLGLGASRTPTASAPTSDEDCLRAAVAAAETARVGAFFIPGIGTVEDLERAADLGLGFVRIGVNAGDIGLAAPFCALAHRLGLRTSINLIKSYALSVDGFADVSAAAEQFGADTVCVVDSASGMLPDEVRAYVEAARNRLQTANVGFRGHDHLQLAVANTLAAVEAGASVVDACLHGAGQRGGHAASEVLVKLLDRLGYTHGIDADQTLDLADQVADGEVVASAAPAAFAPLDLQAHRAPEHGRMNLACGADQTVDEALAKVRRLAAQTGKATLFCLTRAAHGGLLEPRFPPVRELDNLIVGTAEYPTLEIAEDVVAVVDGQVDRIAVDASSGIDDLDHLVGCVQRSAPVSYSNEDATMCATAKLIVELAELRGAERVALVGFSPRWAGLVWTLAERNLDVTVVGGQVTGLPARHRSADELEAVDLVVGCSAHRDRVTGDLARRVRREGALVDAGPGALSESAFEAADELDLPIYSVDRGAGLDSELSLAIDTHELASDILGTRFEAVPVAPISLFDQPGQPGHPGDLVVDHVGSPIYTLGVADGDGGLYADANEALERVERALLARRFFGGTEERDSN